MINNQFDLSGLPDPQMDAQFYAGVPYKRLLAWVIDMVVFWLLYLASILVSLGLTALFAIVAMFAINFGYRAYMLHRKSATLGMIFAGIELRDHNGNRFDGGYAMRHTGLYIVFSVIFPIQIISMAMMLVGARGQGLHDYLLGTTAINRPQD